MAHWQEAPTDNDFLNPSDKFWNLYIADAEKHDKIRLERWKGDADGILIFTGLFAAAVATFIVSTIPSLSPDTGDETVLILSQILAVLGNQTGIAQAAPTISTLPSAIDPTPSTIWVNSLWISSLIMSLVCALFATLVQQWSRVYSQGTQRRGSPSIRGPVYAGLAEGIERFHTEGAISLIVSLLHIAVILFFVGLLVLLWSTNRVVAIVSSTLLVAGALCYIGISLIPVFASWSPYRTPLSPTIKLVFLSITFISVCAIFVFSIVLALFARMCSLIYSRIHDKVVFRGLYRGIPELVDLPFQNTIDATIDMFNRLWWRSVMMAPTASTPLEQMASQRYALKQVCRSADELHEVEQFCESLIPLLNHSTGGEFNAEFDLAETLVRDVKVIMLLRKLAESCIQPRITLPSTSETYNRRIIAIFALTCCLIRCSLPSGMLTATPMLHTPQEELRVTYRILTRISASPLLRHLYEFQLDLPVEQQSDGVQFTLGCFLADLRTHLLVTIAAHVISAPYQSQIAQKLLYSVRGDVKGPHWLHTAHNIPIHSSDVAAFAHEFLLDNFLWLYDRIMSIAMHRNGIALLDSLNNFWIPRFEIVHRVASLHFPRGKELIDESREDLKIIIQKIGLVRLGSPSPDGGTDDWISLAADWGDTSNNVAVTNCFELFERYPILRHSLSDICRKLDRLYSPRWVPTATIVPFDPSGVVAGDYRAFYVDSKAIKSTFRLSELPARLLSGLVGVKEQEDNSRQAPVLVNVPHTLA